MKRLKAIIPLLSALVLVGCSEPVAESKAGESSAKPVESSASIAASSIVSSSAQSQSSTQSSSSSAASSIYQFAADKDVNISYEAGFTSQETSFLLPEFGSTPFRTKQLEGSLDFCEIYYGNNKIIDKADDMYIFAADLNNDHDREIVCTGDGYLIVYDVHNNYEMLKKNLRTEDVPYISNAYTPICYNLMLGKDEKVVLLAWDGSRSQTYYDYACFEYQSQFNALYLYMQNMYDIAEVGYDAIYQGVNEIHPVGDTYELQKGVEYTLKFHINRKEDADLNKVIEAYANTKDELPTSGVYALLNNNRLSTNPGLYCIGDNGFGNYTLRMTIPETAENEGFIRGGYVNLDFRISYRIVE